MDAHRKQLEAILDGKGAHADFDAVMSKFPVDLRGRKPDALPHTAWQLLEHIRIAQADILNFCVNPDYKERKWPNDYWPASTAPPDEISWNQSIAHFKRDLKAMQDLVRDSSNDLDTAIPHGTGQTLFHEALLVIDHNSYHLGEVVMVRHALGIWPPR